MERFLGLIGLVLLEQRATKYKLRASDLVDVVLVAGRLEAQRVTRLLLGLVDVARAQVDLREGRHRLRGIRVAAGLEAMPNASLRSTIALSGLPSWKLSAPRLFVSCPTCTLSERLSYAARARSA